MNLSRLIFLEFLPRSPDVGLLVLRLWLGLTMLLNHGVTKMMNFDSLAPKFADPLNFGSATSLALAIFAEVVCSLLVIFGLVTHVALLPLIFLLIVAFAGIHEMKLSGPQSGELAFIYLAGFVALFIAGPGRYSFDERRPSRRVGA